MYNGIIVKKEDMHIHTAFSTDSDADMRECVLVAIKRGIKRIAFTEHFDADYPEIYRDEIKKSMGETSFKLHKDFDTRPLFSFDFDEYVFKVNDLIDEFKGKIEIETGIELGLRPNRADTVKLYDETIKKYGFKVVLGSIHLVNDKDPYYEREWTGTVDKMISDYFDTMLTCVREYNCFNVLSHIDYIARYIPESKLNTDYVTYFNDIYNKNSDTIDEILKTIISRDIALEINTKGMDTCIKHAHPSDMIFERFKALGGTRVSFGSDAHTIDKVGEHIWHLTELR